jgi:hypothetical protein
MIARLLLVGEQFCTSASLERPLHLSLVARQQQQQQQQQQPSLPSLLPSYSSATLLTTAATYAPETSPAPYLPSRNSSFALLSLFLSTLSAGTKAPREEKRREEKSKEVK